MTLTRPYGTWPSPLTAAAVASGSRRLGGVAVDGDDIYWLESRPHDGGRTVLVRRDVHGRVNDMTPAGTNVRTRVHEYGGGACLVSSSLIVFSEFTDQRLYQLHPAGTGQPTALTAAGPWRYADATLHPSCEWLVAVREDHSAAAHDRTAEPANSLVAIRLGDTASLPYVVAAGADFYAYPRFNHDGSRLLWLSWRHPHMPWQSTELWVARVDAGGLTDVRCVAGGDDDAIFQPGWGPDGALYFVSDRTGWWNLYRCHAGHVAAHGTAEPLLPMAAEFGWPLWQLGMKTWDVVTPTRLLVSYGDQGRWRLATLDLESRRLTPVPTDRQPTPTVAATTTHAVFVGVSSTFPTAVVRVTLDTGETEVVRSVADEPPARAWIAVPEALEFPTGGGHTARANYYAPCNPDCEAPASERPPLIVLSHGGPTDAASPALNLSIQFWTSRGFAVVDVDYGGSCGYGRAYRRRLDGQWGVVDVEDCIYAARFLGSQGKVDDARLIIRGGSAGGYTTLAALAFHPGVFAAGASYYGVSDLEVLARDTHKFESRYLDSLVGPYPARRDLYEARSPIHAVDRIACALILFQGLEDQVVPANQSQMMADAVRAKGRPVAMLLFEGEQHGFRRTETIRRCLEAELYFYGRVFGFTPADPIAPITIDNIGAEHPEAERPA